jgi:hypothetical protein
MSAPLVINGKKYIPSAELAGEFGYTTDYISKLARDEKILGLQIERQWFVEPESLRAHLHKIAIEKEIKKDSLRKERKRERMEREQEWSPHPSPLWYASLSKAVEAGVVLFCGVFFGGLGSLALSDEIDLRALTLGASDAGAYIAKTLYPDIHVVEIANTQNDSLSSVDTISPEPLVILDTDKKNKRMHTDEYETPEAPDISIFASLPQQQRPEEDDSDVAVQKTTLEVSGVSPTLLTSFSDEVRIVVGADGETYFEPVFKNDVAVGMFSIQVVSPHEVVN